MSYVELAGLQIVILALYKHVVPEGVRMQSGDFTIIIILVIAGTNYQNV